MLNGILLRFWGALTSVFTQRKNERLPLPTIKKSGRWTKAEDAVLCKQYGKVRCKTIAKKLGRSEVSVQQRAKKLKLTRVSVSKWTELELKMLRELYPTTTIRALSIVINRPIGGIATQASKLKLKKHPQFMAELQTQSAQRARDGKRA
jgi:hypothetical protein